MIGPRGLLLVGSPPMNRILFYSLSSSQFATLGKKGLHFCEYAKVVKENYATISLWQCKFGE
jgi:hypothetical protein